MQKSTDMWFRYLNKNHMITEGLRDVGLPEFVIDYIEDAMPDASEKARMYIALGWKESTGGMAGAFHISANPLPRRLLGALGSAFCPQPIASAVFSRHWDKPVGCILLPVTRVSPSFKQLILRN